MTDDDRRLADRLRRYESRIPVGDGPAEIRPRPLPWAALAGFAAVLVIGVVLASGLLRNEPVVGDASPTAGPSPDASSAAPSESIRQPAPITAVALEDGGRRLVLEFGGAMESCTEYEAELRLAGEVLEVAVYPTEDDISCRTRLDPRTLVVELDPPFTGTEVRDLASGRTFTVGVAAATASPTSAPTTAAPTPTPMPSGPAEFAWSAGSEQDGSVSAVLRHGDSWIAGGALNDGTTSRAAVWRSSDGIAWSEPVPLPPEPVVEDGFARRYWINGFGEWDGGLLAFGWEGFGCCDGGYPILWRSGDGVTWSVVDAGGTAFGDAYHAPISSTTLPGGELAVLSLTGLGGSGSVFVTPDLVTWSEHPLPSTEEHFSVTAFASSPQMLIAVGSHTPPWVDEPRPEQRVWVSADGRSWNQAQPPSELGSLNDIAWDAARGRFVAVGRDGDGRPSVWLSADGSSWSRSTLSDAPGSVDSIAIADGLIVAGGSSGTVMASEGQTIAWSSYDGVTWQVVPLGDRTSPVVGVSSSDAVLVAEIFRETSDRSWVSWGGRLRE